MEYNLIDTHLKQDTKSFYANICLSFMGACILALCAQISVALPFTPVPVTAQSLAVLLIGAAFGAKRAFATTCLYIVFGLIGLPVFSAGAAGLATLSGVTGGYLIGFVFAATIMGYAGDKAKDRSLSTALVTFLLGHIIIFACGLTWLSFYVPTNKVISLGLMPFLPGMVFKTVLAAIIMPGLWKFVSKEI